MTKSQNTNPKTKPLSIRLTFAERANLERRAKGQALGEFIRSILFGAEHRRKTSGKKTRKPQSPTVDQTAIARVLGMLGKSNISHDLASLAESARLGVFRVTPETEEAIRKACADVRAMRSALMAALGVQER